MEQVQFYNTLSTLAPHLLSYAEENFKQSIKDTNFVKEYLREASEVEPDNAKYLANLLYLGTVCGKELQNVVASLLLYHGAGSDPHCDSKYMSELKRDVRMEYLKVFDAERWLKEELDGYVVSCLQLASEDVKKNVHNVEYVKEYLHKSQNSERDPTLLTDLMYLGLHCPDDMKKDFAVELTYHSTNVANRQECM
ncbi:Hypothetical protein ORPV_264 [Orpheovirus IHUMI-LCC2]|uniref:Uncharacterized protein n=1 Tax=Orpheovirus IHUMI-LCC2 TaxID=2023057 RepID=A0A2I2L3Q6_9VIRU|nr:Hypothetical protein ORPV_264 [Orpheovirus IHUMI-LCC2]SNW62168.1 Hypothetical protein ORPV_264 [Orpheovirus IHUMI-LCC2]